MTNQSLGIGLSFAGWFILRLRKDHRGNHRLLFDLDRDGMIERNVMFGLESRAADQKSEDAERKTILRKVHNHEDKLNFRPHATEY